MDLKSSFIKLKYINELLICKLRIFVGFNSFFCLFFIYGESENILKPCTIRVIRIGWNVNPLCKKSTQKSFKSFNLNKEHVWPTTRGKTDWVNKQWKIFCHAKKNIRKNIKNKTILHFNRVLSRNQSFRDQSKKSQSQMDTILLITPFFHSISRCQEYPRHIPVKRHRKKEFI